ncbi:MAG TPA: DnaB-like helicase N-terminal domain-containing protein, partial [Spirochaetia bacterium]|nr:DnaB-like helicase N-terminal domain-containing protein [Spirochaetia bacterium]
MSDGSLKDKVPPHNAEAELATLGAILLDPDALGRVLESLRPEDFYRAANGKIFSSIISLWERSEAIDLITLTDALKSQGNLDAVGGPAYVSTLTSSVPTSANVEYYAKIVRETSVRRRLLKAANEMIAEAMREGVESREVVEEAERRIFEISEGQQTSGYKQAREIVKQTVEAIEKLYRTREDYTGIPCGFPALDKMLSGFQDSEFIVVGARPSVGKTA